jgi:acyl-CoA synthetase (AMP-forming)/AMP-acid ligase II
MLFPDVARATGVAHPNVVAVKLGDAQLTYRELLDRSCRLANGLRDLGVHNGDRVACLGDNRLESVEHIVGSAMAGAVRATLYSYYSAETNGYLLDYIGARVLITDAAHLEELRDFLRTRPEIKVILVGDGEAGDDVLIYDDLIATSSSDDPAVTVRPDDLYQIRFSSGTSGKPKGICHSFEGWGAVDRLFRENMPPLNAGDVYLCPGSLAHVAIGLFWAAVGAGATVIPLPRFDAGEALRLIETERVTHAAVVPTMIAAMVEHPTAGQLDLSSLRCLTYAGSPIAPKTLARALDLFGRAPYQFFGQSEVVPVSILTGDDHGDASAPKYVEHLRSTGRPLPGVTVTIRDDDNAILARGEVGEIVVDAPCAMTGLWGEDPATSPRFAPDGAVRTRDMGYLDQDDYLFVVDRKDDMIISGGFNIWPAEIEAALREHPAVADVAVIGVPHPRWGETPKAFVVTAAGAAVTDEELIDAAATRVGRVKKPTSIDFVDALPRSDNGKVQRKELRAPYWVATSIQGS